MWNYNPYYENFLAHHGVKGQKWGVRRYQNLDGTLTAKGKGHYLKKLNNWNIRKERHEQRMTYKRRIEKSASNPISKLTSRFSRWLSDKTLFHPIDKGLAPGKFDKYMNKLTDGGYAVKDTPIKRVYIEVTGYDSHPYTGKYYS